MQHVPAPPATAAATLPSVPFAYEWCAPVYVTLGNRTACGCMRVRAEAHGPDMVVTTTDPINGTRTFRMPGAVGNVREMMLPIAFAVGD